MCMFYTDSFSSLLFYFDRVLSYPDSYIQTRPCTVGSAFMFDACVVLFIKIKKKTDGPNDTQD